MNIALVWPKGFNTHQVLPLPLGYLKSNLDHSMHEIRIIDCALSDMDADSAEFRRILRDFKPDVIGVSSWAFTHDEALTVLKTAKSILPHVTTVIGGIQATLSPETTLRNAQVDFLFRGEAELSFPIFMEELQNERPRWSIVRGLAYRSGDGGIIMNKMERETDLDRIEPPDYEAIDLRGYLRAGYKEDTRERMNAPLWVTRGCPWRCSFCPVSHLNGRKMRAHSVGYVTRVVRSLYAESGIRYINIIDDNFTADVRYAKEFCRAMIALNLPGLRFGTPNGIRIQQTDEELLRLMKLAGWSHLCIAPESGSRRMLQLMNKDIDPSSIPEKVRQMRGVGLKVHGFFILGYPGETREDIEETVRLLRACRFDFLVFNHFQPLPGTPIFDELMSTGKIEEDFLPGEFHTGERVYVPDTLEGLNLPFLALREYVFQGLLNPRTIPYALGHYPPKAYLRKGFLNLKNMISDVFFRRPSSRPAEEEIRSQVL